MRFARTSRLVLFGLALLIITGAADAQTTATWASSADIKAGSRGTITGSVTDISETRSELTVVSDEDPGETPIRATADSLVTTYRGFGLLTGDVLRGTPGFSQIRVGDRVQIRGMGGANGIVAAEDVLLIGRSVTAMVPAMRPDERLVGRTVEGTVRSIGRDNRIALETSQRQIHTIVASASTPVTFDGNTYRIANLEVGDRIRVNVDRATEDGIRARSIEVLESVSDNTPRRTLTTIAGRVARIDTRLEVFRLRSDRNREILVNTKNAVDATGRRYRLASLTVGETVEVSGLWASDNEFSASTIRAFNRRDDALDDGGVIDDRDDLDGYDVVTITARVASVQARGILELEDTVEDRRYAILVDEDFVIRLRNGSYATVGRLRTGDRVTVTAFRDTERRLIAQVIRVR